MGEQTSPPPPFLRRPVKGKRCSALSNRTGAISTSVCTSRLSLRDNLVGMSWGLRAGLFKLCPLKHLLCWCSETQPWSSEYFQCVSDSRSESVQDSYVFRLVFRGEINVYTLLIHSKVTRWRRKENYRKPITARITFKKMSFSTFRCSCTHVYPRWTLEDWQNKEYSSQGLVLK